MKQKFDIAQEVIIVPRDTRHKPYKELIVKIGNKYITLENGQRFTIDGLKHESNYGSSCDLYLSQQEFDDEQEKQKLIRFMRNYFDMFSRNEPTLKQLKEIHKILTQ